MLNKQYKVGGRDVKALGELYLTHQQAIVSENLIRTNDFAAELAHKDNFIRDLQDEISKQRADSLLLRKLSLRLEGKLKAQQSKNQGLELIQKQAFDMLQVYGVPLQRARTVSGGIDVLVTRLQKEIDMLEERYAYRGRKMEWFFVKLKQLKTHWVDHAQKWFNDDGTVK